MNMRLALLALISFPCLAYVAAEKSRPLLTGDEEIWDRIFASRVPQVLVRGPSHGLIWTEGPVVLPETNDLIFSDTVGDKIYALDLTSDRGDGRSAVLRVVRDRSGDGRPEDDAWRAERGSNGIALHLNDKSQSKALVCQHGAQRLVSMNFITGEVTGTVAVEYKGRKLNGPNDVIIREEVDPDSGGKHSFAYFTDPVYAWLEKDRFEDLPYLDERVQNDGPGHCGVYRVKADGESGSSVELITANMSRPNGIGFDGDDLIVSDCCQGTHDEGCKGGMSRWELLQQRKDSHGEAASPWVHSETIEDVQDPDEAVGGCSDGFATYSFEDETVAYGRRRHRNKHVLLSSCFGGLCIVDLSRGKVAARLWTAKEEFGGCKISNVVVSTSQVYLTGNCGILALPLQRPMQPPGGSHNLELQDDTHSEL